MSDSEDEEEILLYVEVDGMLHPEVLNQANPFFKLIGLDSDQPIMQIGEEIFRGEYRDVLGTAMFFEEDPLPPVLDPVFSKIPDKPLRYVCKTNKSLVMKRVFLKEKTSGGTKERSNQPHEEQSHRPTSGSGAHAVTPTNDNQNQNIDSSEDLITHVLEGKKVIVQPKVNEKVPTSVSNEPTPGPSWASDIPPMDVLKILSGTGEVDASIEEVSRLIAEQMNISSDIHLSTSTKRK